MGMLLGLLAAVGWGIADFLVSQTSRRVGMPQALFYIQLMGFVAIVAVLLFWRELPQAPWQTWLLAFGLGVLNLAATVMIYRSYAIGKLAIVSPITSGFAVVTALLSLISGERPAPLALGGALLLVAGVIAVARAIEAPVQHAAHAAEMPVPQRAMCNMPPGVPEAIGVAFGFGVYFWGLDFVRPALGPVWPVVVSRGVSVLGVVAWLGRKHITPIRLPYAIWPLVLGTAAMDTVAFLAFNLGIGAADTAIVTALASLFSAITVLLAWAVSRERLAAHQWVGVAVILAGVLLVSV